MHIIKINESLQSGNEYSIPHMKLERVKSTQKLLTDSSNSFLFTQYKPFLIKDKQASFFFILHKCKSNESQLLAYQKNFKRCKNASTIGSTINNFKKKF